MNNENKNVFNSIFLILAIVIGIVFIVFVYNDTKVLTDNTNTEVNNNENNSNNSNNHSNNNENNNNNNNSGNNNNNGNNNNGNSNEKIKISLSLKGNKEINLKVGESYTDPGYSAIGSNGVNYSNKVTVTGSVNTNKVGKYVITYSINYLDNRNTLTRVVNVYANTVAVTGIKTDKDTYSLYVGDSDTIKASVEPSNATNKTLTYTSKDTSIATVSNGTIKGVKAGTTTITILDSSKKVSKTVTVKVTKKEVGKTEEKIHFIKQSVNKESTAGDAILLESNGHYAMIDTGLGNDKDRKFVYDYLKSVGVTKLDFLLITHPHSDHIGNAAYLIDKLTISKVYIKTYDAKDGSKSKDSNKKKYDELISKAKKKNIPVVYIDKSFSDGKGFKFQDMSISLYNTKKGKYDNENGNSVLELIKVNGYKVLLTADFYSYKVNREYILSLSKKSEFKNLDLLKIPHHGYTSCAFKDNKKAASNLNPKYLVITGHSSVCDQVFNSKIPRYYVKKISKNALVVTLGKTITFDK